MVSSTNKDNNDQNNILQNQPQKKKLFLKNSLSSKKAVWQSNKLVVEIKQGRAIQNDLLSNEDKTAEQSIPVSDLEFEKKIQLLKNVDNKTGQPELSKTKQELDNEAEKSYSESDNNSQKNIAKVHPQVANEEELIANIDNAKIVSPDIGKQKEETDKHNTNKKKSSTQSKSPENIKIPKKVKIQDETKWTKSSLISALDQKSGDIIEKRRSLASYKRAQEKIKRKQQNINVTPEKPVKIYREIDINNEITISELANKLSELSSRVVHELKKLGVDYRNKDQILSRDVAELISVSLGHKVKISEQINIENILKIPEDDKSMLKIRPPIVAFMGHVDHGKTSLLDAFRSTDIVSSESGGITQHIGSYNIKFENGESITFIDTPGHEAFMKIRSRGSAITDIIVLVISVEDGIKEQTIEAINHSKSAKVPIIVALNKIDKDSSKIEKIKSDLLSYDIISEDLGGDVMFVNVSAKKKINLDKLRESIHALAEMMSLKANYDANASGVILESSVDSKIGNTSKVLVQRGSLKVGNILISGVSIGKVKSIVDDNSKNLSELTPSLVGSVSGFDVVPSAGEKFYALESEQKAYSIVSYRKKLHKRESEVELKSKKSLDELFNKPKIASLFLIIKVDVFGSMEAISYSLSQIKHPEVNLKIINIGIGNINLSDINLALTSDASVIGFNVKSDVKVQRYAESNFIELVYFDNIYQILDFVKDKLSALLSPIKKETCIGTAQIRKIFDISKTGKILGCYVMDGLVKNHCNVKILRQNKLIYEDVISSIKQFKAHVKEVRTGLECGIILKNQFSDAQTDDVIKIYEISEEKNTI